MPAFRSQGCVLLLDPGLDPSLLQFPELVINDDCKRRILWVSKWHGHRQESLGQNDHFAVLVSRKVNSIALWHDPGSWSSARLWHEINLGGAGITLMFCSAVFVQWDILKFLIVKDNLHNWSFLTFFHNFPKIVSSWACDRVAATTPPFR